MVTMSREAGSNSDPPSPFSSAHSDSRSNSQTVVGTASNNKISHTKTAPSNRKKSNKVSKPRLTASQKNTNHKDAENKRRNAIRERFTDLSKMVPGAEGQERSEQVMLGKTTEFLKDMLKEQRALEAICDKRGIILDEKDRLRDTDYGGRNWQEPNMAQYENSKIKKDGGSRRSSEG